MTNQIEQVASKARSEDDPYVVGWNEGKKFAEDRQRNLERLDAGSQEFLHCKIRRDVWRRANRIWQDEHSSPDTYLPPQEILEWLVLSVPEMRFRNTWAEGEGYLKGFLERRGLKVTAKEI